MLRFISFVCLAVLSFTGLAQAQQVGQQVRRYDGIQAGLDAYNLAEERRQANLQAQIGANDAARAASGLPTTRGETIYYYGGYSPYGVVPWDGAYAYGTTFGYATTGRFGRRVASFSTGPVFTPWPYVAGDIYGYRTYPQVRQPIGTRQVQIDDNTWESHPVYDPPMAQHPVLPPVNSPLLRNTPFEAERPQPVVEEELPPAQPQPTSTAREF